MDNEKPLQTGQRHRGIYLLPNLFTTAALFSGFYAVVSSMDGNFQQSAIAIFIAMIFDGLDGRIARLTNTQSEFGAQYDSLADMISFGIAPALVMYQWSLFSMNKLGWLAAFIYTAGAALRLARFNTQLAVADKRYFQGLPSPAAAAIMAGAVWVGTDYTLQGIEFIWITLLLTVATGVLMVSNIRYYSFKDFNPKDKVRFVSLLVVVLVFVLVSIDPPLVLFGAFICYLLSGPVITIMARLNLRRQRKNIPPTIETEKLGE